MPLIEGIAGQPQLATAILQCAPIDTRFSRDFGVGIAERIESTQRLIVRSPIDSRRGERQPKHPEHAKDARHRAIDGGPDLFGRHFARMLQDKRLFFFRPKTPSACSDPHVPASFNPESATSCFFRQQLGP